MISLLAPRMVFGIQIVGQITLCVLAFGEVVIKVQASSDFEDRNALVRTEWKPGVVWCTLIVLVLRD